MVLMHILMPMWCLLSKGGDMVNYSCIVLLKNHSSANVLCPKQTDMITHVIKYKEEIVITLSIYSANMLFTIQGMIWLMQLYSSANVLCPKQTDMITHVIKYKEEIVITLSILPIC